MSDTGTRDIELGRLLGRLDAIERDLALIKERLDTLTTAFNMGRGAFRTMAKLGGLMLALAAAAAWLVENLPAWLSRP
jgi:hypothetical protein